LSQTRSICELQATAEEDSDGESHYKHLPTGPWFALLRPELTLVEAVVPEEIFGRPIEHFAHKADVRILRVLKEKRLTRYRFSVLRLSSIQEGSTSTSISSCRSRYLCGENRLTQTSVRPFTPLMYHPTTLGMEASPDSRRTELDPTGLCVCYKSACRCCAHVS
jgi:hypothetical protein